MGPTVRKSPPLSVQQFRVQVAIPYLDTLIANINSRFSGEVVELVVSASVFNPALLPDDGHFSELMVTLRCQMEKNLRKRLKQLHILLLVLSKKKNC